MNSGKLNSPVKRRNVAVEFPSITPSSESIELRFVRLEGRLTEDNKIAIASAPASGAVSAEAVQFG